MLRDACAELTRGLSKLDDVHRANEMSETLKTRHDLLQQQLALLRHLKSTRQVLQGRGLSVPMKAGLGRATVVSLRKTLGKVVEDPSKWGDNRLWTDELSKVALVQREVRAALQATWQAYTEVALQGFGGEQAVRIMATLEQIPKLRLAVRRARALRDSLESQARALPDTEQQCAQFDAALAELNTAWAAIPWDGLPEDVHAFLSRAVSGGAPLDLLTEGVTGWLGRQGMEGGFVVTVKQ